MKGETTRNFDDSGRSAGSADLPWMFAVKKLAMKLRVDLIFALT
jgi:hypothetical protein